MTHAVFIGGSSGIGLAAARLAVTQGWQVTIASRDPERADVEAEKASVDITDQRAVREFFTRTGPVDHLFCSTTARASGTVRELDLVAGRLAFEAKYWGPLTAVQVAEVTESITLSSGVAASTPMRAGAITGSINGAVEALVRTLAVELAPVRVNAVAPGVIETPLWAGLDEEPRRMMFDRLENSLPAGRIGTPDDVAAAVLFLMRNDFVTGEVVHVDGGHRLAAP